MNPKKQKTYNLYLKEVLGGMYQIKAKNKVEARAKFFKVLYGNGIDMSTVMEHTNEIEVEHIEERKTLKNPYHN